MERFLSNGSRRTKIHRIKDKIFHDAKKLLETVNLPDGISIDIKMSLGNAPIAANFIKVNNVVTKIAISRPIPPPVPRPIPPPVDDYPEIVPPPYIKIEKVDIREPAELLHLACKRSFVKLRTSKDGDFICNTLLHNISSLDQYTKGRKNRDFIQKFNTVIRQYYLFVYGEDPRFEEYNCMPLNNPRILRSLGLNKRSRFFKFVLREPIRKTGLSPEDQITADAICDILVSTSASRGMRNNSVKMAATQLNVTLNKAYNLVRMNDFKKFSGK